MAALMGKLEAEVDYNSSADKFYNISSQSYHIANASDTVREAEVHDDWETTGSVRIWKFTVDGNVENFKDKVEIDDENKMVLPKSEGGSVKVTLEYEKLNENVPPPTKYLDLIVNIINDIDAHDLKA
ncbi:MLP-like protein 43 [Castanea sativa]|uniref:MLP-like protein 43 n=1 Tax=Castanea sativa TaxID=21020 RepID=UPI003F64E480